MNRFLVVSFFLGCSGESTPPPPESDADADVDADADADSDGDTDADSDGDCLETWSIRSDAETIAAGGQDYRCWSAPAPRTGYAIRITPVVPDAQSSVMHHMVLMKSGPFGMVDCMAAEAFNPIVFGSGVATGSVVMPPDVGLPVVEGDPYILQIHLTNATDEDVPYEMGVDLCLVESVAVEADTVVWGPSEISVPDDGVEHTQTASCPVTGEDRTIFAAFGHMHQLGTHTELGIDGETFAAVDPWDFSNQPILAVEPQLVVHPGDELTVNCSWLNPVGNGEVSFGPWTDDEMCLPSAYYYPAGLRDCFEFTN